MGNEVPAQQGAGSIRRRMLLGVYERVIEMQFGSDDVLESRAMKQWGRTGKGLVGRLTNGGE